MHRDFAPGQPVIYPDPAIRTYTTSDTDLLTIPQFTEN